MVRKVEKQEKKKFPFLVIVALVLYVFAVVFLIFAVNELRNYLAGTSSGFFSQVGNNEFEFIFNFSFDGYTIAINYFIDSAVFFIWGTVLLIIHRISRKKKIKPTEEEYILDDIEAVSENIEKSFVNNERIYCAYCDSELGVNDRKCPHCGASKKVRKC